MLAVGDGESACCCCCIQTQHTHVGQMETRRWCIFRERPACLLRGVVNHTSPKPSLCRLPRFVSRESEEERGFGKSEEPRAQTKAWRGVAKTRNKNKALLFRVPTHFTQNAHEFETVHNRNYRYKDFADILIGFLSAEVSRDMHS